MKTQTAPIFAQLAEAAPAIAFSASRSIDSYYSWDGDGPDPRDEGFDPCNVDVQAFAILGGSVIEGHDYLGGCYYRHDEPMGDVHGYLLQMLQAATEELLRNV